MFTTLDEFASTWTDTPEHHQLVADALRAACAADPVLRKHREYVTANNLGFGDDSFWGLFSLVANQFPKACRVLEVGVYKGASLSLLPYLHLHNQQRHCVAVGVSTYDGRNLYQADAGEGVWTKPDGHDYRTDVVALFKHFFLENPVMVVGDSTHPATAYEASKHGPYDLVYIDGSHQAKDVEEDLYNYAEQVKEGGILACDDCGAYLNLPKQFFGGFLGCSAKINEHLPLAEGVFDGMRWRHLGSCIHMRLWRRIS